VSSRYIGDFSFDTRNTFAGTFTSAVGGRSHPSSSVVSLTTIKGAPPSTALGLAWESRLFQQARHRPTP
jgi:hypothetical protein